MLLPIRFRRWSSA